MTPVQPCRNAPSFWRPTRGAVRLNALFNPEPLQVDLRHLEQAVDWSVLKDGQHWARIVLLRNEFRHPVLPIEGPTQTLSST